MFGRPRSQTEDVVGVGVLDMPFTLPAAAADVGGGLELPRA
jgi:hypothetical protein